VPGSTPVIAFGNPTTARVATLGLNPSRVEFLSPSGALMDADRRLETLPALGVITLRGALPLLVERVWYGCCTYFMRNPYRRWFDQLEAVLRPMGASYYAGSACHLDLVQWATDPTWGHLDCKSRATLLNEDVPFLCQQLAAFGVTLLLINGRSVVREFEQTFGRQLDLVDTLRVGRQTALVFAGRVPPHIRVVAWSLNLRSSYGVTNELRRRLAERVATVALHP